MNSQVERGTVREMVHSIVFSAGVLERILQEPVHGSLEIRSDELAHVKLLQRKIDDLSKYLGNPSSEQERTAKVKNVDEINAYCDNCDRPISDWWTYCASCGARLEWE